MEDLLNYLSQYPLFVQVIAYVVTFNVVVLAVIKVLESIKDKTTSDVDDKAYIFLTKIQKFIGVLVAYQQKKEEPK